MALEETKYPKIWVFSNGDISADRDIEFVMDTPYCDCGDNVALFKAIAALNDEDDFMQYFVDKADDAVWMLCTERHLRDIADENEWRKATLEEIAEHFKTAEQ